MKKTNFSYDIARKSNFFERSSEKPIKSFVPHQSMPLCELVRRFESGQRLNVKMNFDPSDQFTRDNIYEEDFEDAPPDDIHDVVDVQNALAEHEQRMQNFKEKRKRKPASQPEEKKPIEPQQSEVNPTEEMPEE